MHNKHEANTRRLPTSRAVIWLSVALGVSVLCAWANWRVFQPLGFEAPKLWRSNLRSIIFIDSFQIVAFVVAILAIRHSLKRLPGRTILRLVIITSILVMGISVVTLPTRSQDFYHDAVLIQNYVLSGGNPYTLTPAEVGGPWASYLLNWLDVGYIYGPLFALLLSAIMALEPSLLTAAILMKLLSMAAVGLTAWVMWLIMGARPLAQKAMVLALFCLNPLTIQAGIVDVHADIFIGLGLTAGYYLYAKHQYTRSLWLLFLAGLGKFVSVVLMPLPLLGILFNRSISRLQKLKQITIFSVSSFLIALLFFSPFGIRESLNGISVMTSFRLKSYESPGSLLLMDGLGLSVYAVRVLGVLLAVGAGLWLFRRKLSPRHFTIPIALFLFFGFPVFQPWYLLWILPLVCTSERYWVVLALSAPFSLLNPNINYSVWKATSIFVLLIFGGILCKNLLQGQQVKTGSKAIQT